MQPTESNFMFVFVYGTLKRGEPNHDWLSDGRNGYSKFVCKATTVDRYPLIIASKYNIPFLLDSPGCGKIVSGEIFEIDSKMLSNLDILEEYPEFYGRELQNFCGDNGLTVNAWVYLLQKYRSDLLKSEHYSEYQSNGSHRKTYCERFLRDSSYNLRLDIQGD